MFEDIVGKPIDDYLNDTKMENDTVWETEVEILALATFLETPTMGHNNIRFATLCVFHINWSLDTTFFLISGIGSRGQCFIIYPDLCC